MVTLRVILPIQLEEFVRIAFREDTDLLTKFHIVTGDLDTCVKDTLNRIAEVEKKDPLNYFSVFSNDTPIGFTVTGPHCLFSFGINYFYRDPGVLSEWWEAVCKFLGYEFATWLFLKNTRAIGFLKKMGMIENATSYNGKGEPEFVTLINYKPCQQEV